MSQCKHYYVDFMMVLHVTRLICDEMGTTTSYYENRLHASCVQEVAHLLLVLLGAHEPPKAAASS